MYVPEDKIHRANRNIKSSLHGGRSDARQGRVVLNGATLDAGGSTLGSTIRKRIIAEPARPASDWMAWSPGDREWVSQFDCCDRGWRDQVQVRYGCCRRVGNHSMDQCCIKI